LSNRIIGDLDSTTRRPYSEDFEDHTAIAAFDEEMNEQYAELQNLKSKMETVEKTIATAKENYANEKQSFDNWLQTRKTLGTPDKDQEVIDRANRLDDFYKVEQEWRAQLNAIQSQIDEKDNEMEKIRNSIYGERSAAYEKYGNELKWYELKVFLIRLIFVAPVLALGIFFFFRF
jgi:DNA repair ATPase RecN